MAFERITPRYIDGRKLTDAEISLLISKILGNEEYVAALKPPIIANLKSEDRERRLNGLQSVSKYEKYLEHTMAIDAEAHKPDSKVLEEREKVRANQARQQARAERDRAYGRELAIRSYLPQEVRAMLVAKDLKRVRAGIGRAKKLMTEHNAKRLEQLLGLKREAATHIFERKLTPLREFARTELQRGETVTQTEALYQFAASLQTCWDDVVKLEAWINQAERWVEKLEARRQRAEKKAYRPAPGLPAPQAGMVDWSSQDKIPVATKAYCEGRVAAGTPSRGKAVPMPKKNKGKKK